MSRYTEYFLKSKSSVVELDTLEISHPSFTQVYRIVRNATQGVTVTLEDLSVVEFQYRPMKIVPVSNRDDLDQFIRIDLGDLGEILPRELDAVFNANDFSSKPIVKYRAYRSDDLTEPLLGPWILEIGEFSFNRMGASFEAKAPRLNINRTGELYRIERFPMLRGYV